MVGFPERIAEGRALIDGWTDDGADFFDRALGLRAVLVALGEPDGAIHPMSVEDNIRMGSAAMARVVETQSDQPQAMRRNELGWIDFIWGDEGAPPNTRGKRKGANGIAHIIDARIRKDGLSHAQVVALLERVVEAIARGSLEASRYHNTKSHVEGTKAVIQYEGIEAVLMKDDGASAWLLTGYEKTSDASGQGGGKAGATHVGPTPPRPDVGAEDTSSLAPDPPEGKPTRDSAAPDDRARLRRLIEALDEDSPDFFDDLLLIRRGFENLGMAPLGVDCCAVSMRR